MPGRSTSSCPVGYTCPDIDGVIDIIKDVVERLRSISQKPVNQIEDEGDNLAEELRDLYSGHNSKLEKLRDQNSQLREWGEGLESELDDLKDELEKTNERLSGFERQAA